MMILTRNMWMNTEMDGTCKRQGNKIQGTERVTRIPGKPWGCLIDGRKLIKNIDSGTTCTAMQNLCNTGSTNRGYGTY